MSITKEFCQFKSYYNKIYSSIRKLKSFYVETLLNGHLGGNYKPTLKLKKHVESSKLALCFLQMLCV